MPWQIPLSISNKRLLLLRTGATHAHHNIVQQSHAYVSAREASQRSIRDHAAQQRNANQPVKLPAAAKTARLSRPSASQRADTGWAKSCGWRNDLSRTHVLAKSLTGVRAPALATTTIRQKDLTVRYPKLEKEVKDVQQMHACLAAGEAIRRSICHHCSSTPLQL